MYIYIYITYSTSQEIDAALSDPPVTASDIDNLEAEHGLVYSGISRIRFLHSSNRIPWSSNVDLYCF